MADDSMAGTAQATAPGAITFLPLLALPQALLVALYGVTSAWSAWGANLSNQSKARCHCLPLPQTLVVALYVITCFLESLRMHFL